MKLNELYKMLLEEALKQMNLIDMKVHSDDGGEIKTIEVKYIPGAGSELVPARPRTKRPSMWED